MLTRLVVIIIIAWIVYIWFEWWVVYTINHDIDRKEKNYKELTDEIQWWKKQTHEALAEVNEWKRKYNDMQSNYNKERNKVFELEQKISWNAGKYLKKNDKTKKTILEENKELVIKCYKQWMTMKWIAENFKCSPATVKRALKKWNVNRHVDTKRIQTGGL